MDETRNISLKCGVCGNTSFEYDEALYSSIEEAQLVKCTVCKKVYTKEELKEANSTLINNTEQEMVKDFIKGLGLKLK